MTRNLQILPDIPDLPSGIKVIAASYEVSRSPYFEDTENNKRDEKAIIVSNLEDTVNTKGFWIDIPNLKEDDDIYARYQLHLEILKEDGSKVKADMGWSRPVNMKGDQEGFLVSDVIIATPKVSVNVSSNTLTTKLNVVSSPMELFVGYGDHVATSWEIANSDGVVVFSRKKSKDMLQEITIPMDNFQHDEVYIVKAKYHTSTNMESDWGCFILNSGITLKDLYEVITPEHLVSGRDLHAQVVLNTNRFISISLILKDKNENIVAQTINHKDLYPTVKIPALKPGDIYRLYGRLEYEPGVYTSWKLIRTYIAKDNNAFEIDPTKVYIDKYLFIQPIIQPDSKFLFSRELLTGGYVMPRTDEADNFLGLSYFIFEGGKFQYVKDIQGTENIGELKPLSNWSIGVIPLYNGEVLICKSEVTQNIDNNGQGKLNFLKYSYDSFNLIFKLTGTAKGTKQFGSTGVSGSMVAMLDNSVYYTAAIEGAPKAKTKLALHKLNANTMAIEKVADLPFEAKEFVSLCMLNNTEFLVLGGNNDTSADNPKDWVRSNPFIYKFNTEDKSFTKIGDLTDVNIPKWYNQHVVLLKNGKVAIFNNSEGIGVAEDQSIVIFDPTTGLANKLDNDFSDGRMYLKTLVSNTGNVIRISSSIYQPQMMYMYRTSDYVAEDIENMNLMPSPAAELIVPANTSITVDNLYKYSKIEIQGKVADGTSGKLTVIGPRGIREFDSDTFFITKSMVLYENTVDNLTKGKTYKNIFVLDGADITTRDDNEP